MLGPPLAPGRSSPRLFSVFFLTITGSGRILGGFARVDEAGRREGGYLTLKTYGGPSLFSRSVF
jgi:hypothetical protein